MPGTVTKVLAGVAAIILLTGATRHAPHEVYPIGTAVILYGHGGIVGALPSPARMRSRRDIGDYGGYRYPMDLDLSQQDVLLLQKLLSPPVSKRQLCPSGYSYNPVYGGCRASLALLRGRSRSGMF